MKSAIVIFILLFQYQVFIYAQKKGIVIAEGTAQVEWLKTKSRVETEKQAEQLAAINALEKAFGKVIIQGNS